MIKKEVRLLLKTSTERSNKVRNLIFAFGLLIPHVITNKTLNLFL